MLATIIRILVNGVSAEQESMEGKGKRLGPGALQQQWVSPAKAKSSDYM